MTNRTKKKKKVIKKKVFRHIVYFLFILSLFTLGTLLFLNVLPTVYFALLGILIVALDCLITYFLLGKGTKKRLFGILLTIVIIILQGFIVFYSIHTLDFLKKINGQDYNTENYNIIALKNSNYDKLKDLKEEDIGFIESDDDQGIQEAKKYLNKKVKMNFVSYNDLADLYKAFINEDIEAILIEDAEKSILEEDYEDFLQEEKIVYTFSINLKLNDSLAKEVDIIKSPFNIYISGIDTYGRVTSVSRSDVNMVVSIHPESHKMLFTSIPRDYYVPLHGINTTYKDKLTHAGIHGVDTSLHTIEDLLDIDINYYAKVNFTSLIAIVDELGGIEVNTDEAFRAYYVEDTGVVNYSFKKGTNKLNGKQALAYSRERKSLPGGDVDRVKHQQQVLEAIIHKVLSKSILTKYSDILKALEDKVVTNMGTKNITKFVKEQLKNMSTWEIDTNTLSGEGAMEYTYSYKNAKSYVMIPDTDSVNEAKMKIKNLTNE